MRALLLLALAHFAVFGHARRIVHQLLLAAHHLGKLVQHLRQGRLALRIHLAGHAGLQIAQDLVELREKFLCRFLGARLCQLLDRIEHLGEIFRPDHLALLRLALLLLAALLHPPLRFLRHRLQILVHRLAQFLHELGDLLGRRALGQRLFEFALDAVEFGAQVRDIAIFDADRDLPQEVDGGAHIVFVPGIADARRHGADRDQRPRLVDKPSGHTSSASSMSITRLAFVGIHHQRLALFDQRLRQRHLELAFGQFEALHFAFGGLAGLILGDQAHVDVTARPRDARSDR